MMDARKPRRGCGAICGRVLWVATQGGLVRFDGVRFQRVDLAGAPGTIAGTMRVLIEDRYGRIWLAKEEGGRCFASKGRRCGR